MHVHFSNFIYCGKVVLKLIFGVYPVIKIRRNSCSPTRQIIFTLLNFKHSYRKFPNFEHIFKNIVDLNIIYWKRLRLPLNILWKFKKKKLLKGLLGKKKKKFNKKVVLEKVLLKNLFKKFVYKKYFEKFI